MTRTVMIHRVIVRRTYAGRLDSVSMICLGMRLFVS